MNSFSKQYFKHDLYSRNDPKLLEVLMNHGLSGLGFWWCILEILYEQNNRIEQSQCSSIAYALHMDMQLHSDLIASFCRIGLLQEKKGIYSSDNVGKRISETLKNWNDRSEKAKKAAHSRWNRTSMQTHSTSNADAMQKECESMPKEKNRIEKNRKEKNIRERELLVSLFEKNGCTDHLDSFLEHLQTIPVVYNVQSYAKKYIQNKLQEKSITETVSQTEGNRNETYSRRIDDVINRAKRSTAR